MASGSRIEITDKEGWRKEFSLNKRLIYVGSDIRNDIVLSPVRGTGVSPRHLQLIAMPGANRMISAVNLSPVGIPLGEGGSRVLEPNSALEVADGESYHLGDFTLTFHLQEFALSNQPAEASPVGQSSPQGAAGRPASIGLRVSLPQPVINPDNFTEGIIYISNLGNVPGIQFKLWIEGLPPECYEIGPAPILFPGAEKGIPFRLRHPRRPGYAAGTHPLFFKAEAPDAYPAESAIVKNEIRFSPFYSHTLRLMSLD
jgi:hypothetical protein